MKLISIIILLVFQSSFAKEESISVEAIEKIFLDEIKSQKSSDDDKYLLFSLAGRELYNYKYYDKSKEYYKKALELKTNKDKTEVYINLISIEYAQKKSISKNTYSSAMDYFESSKKIKNDGLKQYMQFINSNFIDKNSKKIYKGFYGEFSKQTSITDLIKAKKYKEALSMINSSHMKSRDLGTQVRYDLLRSIVLGRANLSLFCQPKFDQYPHSIAWTIESCKVLLKYQEGSLPTQSDIKTISSAVKEQSSSRLYLINAFGDLK